MTQRTAASTTTLAGDRNGQICVRRQGRQSACGDGEEKVARRCFVSNEIRNVGDREKRARFAKN